MKKIIDAVKDFIYNITDYSIILIVVITVGAILTWRFSVLFNTSYVAKVPDTDLPTGPEIEVSTPITSNNNSDESGNEGQNTDSENTASSGSEIENENNEANSETNTTKPSTVSFSIPAGSSTVSIAKIVAEKGLVENTDDFLNKAMELKLDTKLKPGEFEVSSDISIEELVKEIAHAN